MNAPSPSSRTAVRATIGTSLLGVEPVLARAGEPGERSRLPGATVSDDASKIPLTCVRPGSVFGMLVSGGGGV